MQLDLVVANGKLMLTKRTPLLNVQSLIWNSTTLTGKRLSTDMSAYIFEDGLYETRASHLGCVPNRILFYFTYVRTAATLTKYVLLHTV